MKKKLLILVIIPLLLSVGVAVFISALKIKKNGEQALEEKSLAILRRMEAVRTYVANEGLMEGLIKEMVEKHPDGNLTDEEMDKVKNQVPIIASWKIGMKDSDKDNYEFRIATLQDVARNKKNIATAKELEFINEFLETKKELITYKSKEENKLWVMKPVYIRETENCLACHGTPENSPYGNGKDILGYDMESMKDGEFRGLFIIKSDLKPVQESANEAIASIGLWGLILVVLSSTVAFIYVNYFTNTFREVTQVITSIAEGDLTKEVTIEASDELKLIKDGINNMLKKLREVILQVNGVSYQIANASTEMNLTSQQISDRANEQASSAEEVSASMEQMVASIQQNVSNSKETEKIAVATTESLHKSSESVNKTIISMETIAEKISIIDEISQQTNLLALNAAVEAARAGEHGKGFAVVAGEVRKLAEHSQQAAAEIDKMSRSSVEIAQKSGKMLVDILPEIKKNARMMREITSTSIEQNTGAEQVNAAIQQLNQIVQLNAAVAEEMADGSEELSAQAQMLKQTISYFNLEDKHIYSKKKSAKEK
ncbi:MAG: methyl-accepting chemotaxis protein [Cyclobacteriaceae bacterium]|nr:methyl-accepting chemotaxis protein [Cyclobacteriaceae bacterium]